MFALKTQSNNKKETESTKKKGRRSRNIVQWNIVE